MIQLDDGADLRALMDRSLRAVHAPEHCGPAAVANGRRLRTRRRLGVGLAGVAAVTAAALTLPALGDSGSAGPEAPIATDPTRAPEPTQEPVPEPTDWPDTPAGWWDMPSTQMLDQLRQLLPDGVAVTTAVTTMDSPGDENRESEGALSGTLSASTGPGSFQILLYAPDVDPSEIPDPVTTTDAEGNQITRSFVQGISLADRIRCRGFHDTCLPISDDAGEQIGRVSTDTERGTLLYEVTLLGPDGGGLNLTVMNSSGEKPGYEQPSAEVPPLTPDQLRALAEDPAWTSYVP